MHSAAILLLFCYLIHIANSYKSSCIKSHCNGPFSLQNYTIHITEMKSKVKGTIYTISDEGGRKRTIEKKAAKYYFYNGGALDSNSRVEINIKNFNATKDEFDLMKCHIGPSYKPGELWGSDAEMCNRPLVIDRYSAESDSEYFKYNAEYWDAPFSHHMCVITWRCKTHSGRIPIHFSKMDIENIKVHVSTFGMKGEEIELCQLNVIIPGKVDCGYEHHDGDFSSSITYSGYITTEEKEIVCFSHSTKSMLCKSATEPFVYEMSCGSEWCAGISSRTLLKVKKDIISLASPTTHQEVEIDAAASIEDLKKTQKAVLFEVENTHYNLEVIQYDVYSIYNIVNKMALSLGKLDDELLPHLLEREGKTTWMTENIFNVCPCYNVEMKEGRNCNEGHIYDNGRVKKIESDEEKQKCITFKTESISRLDLFKNKDVFINELEFEPPNGTSEAWEGWTWISETREKAMENDGFVEKMYNNTNPFYQIFHDISSPFCFWQNYKYLLSTSALTYFNTVALLYIMCKKGV